MKSFILYYFLGLLNLSQLFEFNSAWVFGLIIIACILALFFFGCIFAIVSPQNQYTYLKIYIYIIYLDIYIILKKLFLISPILVSRKNEVRWIWRGLWQEWSGLQRWKWHRRTLLNVFFTDFFDTKIFALSTTLLLIKNKWSLSLKPTLNTSILQITYLCICWKKMNHQKMD